MKAAGMRGISLTTTTSAKKLAERLSVPEGYELVCVLPIGIADEAISSPKKKAFSERAWFNGTKII